MQKPDEIIERKLRELGIPYERHDHAPIMTVEEGRVLAREYGSFCIKNLFLTARKRFCLLMMPSEKSFSSKALAKQLVADTYPLEARRSSQSASGCIPAPLRVWAFFLMKSIRLRCWSPRRFSRCRSSMLIPAATQ